MKPDSQFSMKYNKQTSSNFSVLYQARYCNQDDISLVVCKDGIIKMLEPPLSLRNYTSSKPVCTLPKTNRDSKLVVSGSNRYLFGKYQQSKLFLSFSESSKSFNVLPSMLDKRSRFDVCSFMQKIIVIGGNISCWESINSCMAYDCKINKWTYIASMNESRGHTSSTVFKGKVVVTGGWVQRNFSFRKLKSVEAYCFYENKWTQFPDMLREKSGHNTVSIGNKMFVISIYLCDGCEVFDSISNSFTLLKKYPNVKNIHCYSSKAITIGYKIHMLIDEKLKVKRRMSTFCYDVTEKSWSSDDTSNIECYDSVSCAKMFKR